LPRRGPTQLGVRLSAAKELNLTFHPDAESMVKICDLVTNWSSAQYVLSVDLQLNCLNVKRWMSQWACF